MAQFDLANLRFLLTGETDDGSPVSEELMSQIRELLEILFMLAFDTGVSGTLTSDPPNDATGEAEDTAAGFVDDKHNGRTLLITSGNGIGENFTIDDTVAADNAVYCTGDNLYTAGVRSGDSYKILFDIKNNADGHDHDNVNSRGTGRTVTGTYTGDGSTSQAISGLGISPKFLMIFIHPVSDQTYNYALWVKMDQSWGQNAFLIPNAITAGHLYSYDNRVISLDADGFTVDDDGLDADPNTNGETYDYVAWG